MHAKKFARQSLMQESANFILHVYVAGGCSVKYA